MNKDTALHLVLMVMCILVSAACFLISAPFDRIVRMLEPLLFFSVFLGVMSNGFYPFVMGAAAPLLIYFLLGDEAIVPQYSSWMCAYAFGGMTAGLLYVFLNSSVVSVIGGTLASRIVLGIVNMIGYLSVDRTYDIGTFFREAFIVPWPGIVVTVILIPILTAVFRKLGVMQELHPKINYNR